MARVYRSLLAIPLEDDGPWSLSASCVQHIGIFLVQ